jgi:hypothetical protein
VNDADLCARLDVAEEDARLVLAGRPRDDESRAVVERWRTELAADGAGPIEWPARGDFLHVWAFLAALPDARRRHAERAVPDDVSWATLADLGIALAEHRRRHGRPGFDHAWWLARHWRGRLYRLGRLQFELYDDALGIHIPRGAPLDPEACDASFATARAFFARHLPEQPAAVARCTSWLLDPQLAEYLPPDSNIVRFQRRFELDDEVEPGDDDIRMFVFGAAAASPPQRTALERAIVAHLRAGRHWHTRSGWVMIG